MKLSIRMMMALLFVGTLGLSYGFVLLTIVLLEGQLKVLLPADVLPQVLNGVHALLMYQVIAIGVVAVVLAILAFLILSALVVIPLRKILGVMAAFSERGERQVMPAGGMMPSELSTLADVLSNYMDRVEAAHNKDTEISRVKSDFISTAAHQLRTPLTGIRWALEALEREALSQEQQVLVKSAVDKSHDLVAIVGTLLDISSIESGKYKYTFVPVEMSQLVSEVTTDFSTLASQRKVALNYVPSKDPLPEVKADRDRIKWILNNLIENAIRYTPDGGSITVSTNLAARQVQVRVRDTGIGIPEKERGNIFERFFRAGNAITKENQGNGLGLYIARTIATDHGGDLDFIANTEGPGTTFILSFPIPG
ncbi:MAG: two-component system, NarL family, sensor histidine kinase BarA [Parcubacteria bacterium C7867-008]|nr:MAG: two-component system, NarL family, sensor histidine kinase BarA [Parcubacteria bacterium C7867-008]